ncbi:MAG: signal peptidase II [Candidatus Aminicenantaceae bacterium]
MRRRFIYYLLVFSVLIADQLTKYIISRTLELYKSVVVIPGFFSITHARNRGAIFGFFSQSGSQLMQVILTGASLIALALVIYYFFKTSPEDKIMKISLSLILGGAIGNLIDRVLKGYVVDFADFYIKNLHWPSFNFADASITIGAILLVYIILRGKQKCFLSWSK